MYQRELTQVILKKIHSKEIIFLLGTRQTGKTTLTKLIAEASDFDKNNIFFIDFEDKEYRGLFNIENAGVNTIRNILKLEGIDPGKKCLLIFDEIQLLNDPSNILKLLYDYFPDLKIIATGSSSFKIKHKFTDSLAGRKIVYRVEPLNFDEFLLFKGEDKLLKIRELFGTEEKNDTLNTIIKSHHQKFIGLFEEYLVFGGYPEVALLNSKNDKIEKLFSIADSYIKKDIRDIATIENIDAYNNLLKYLAVNAGNLLNISSAGTTVGLSSATLLKYINLLKETFIIDELLPFFINKNKEISKNKKIYFKDTGIRNLQLKNFNSMDIRPDAGTLYENYVFNCLEKNHDILYTNYFYRTKSKTEIDFISEKEGSVSLIEVKSGKFNKKPKALFEFDKKYKQHFIEIKKTVINNSYFMISDEISYLPAYLL